MASAHCNYNYMCSDKYHCSQQSPLLYPLLVTKNFILNILDVGMDNNRLNIHIAHAHVNKLRHSHGNSATAMAISVVEVPSPLCEIKLIH